MAYDYYSQMQGPAISVSLFADSYSKGVDAGNAVPSPVKAVVDGLLGGYQTGQKIQQNNQVLEQNQHTIDRQPVEDQLQDEQLQAAQQKNDIQALELEVAQGTQTEQLDYTKAALTEKANQLKAQSALRKKGEDFSKAYQEAATPQLKKQLIFSGQFNDYFAANPNAFKSSVLNPEVFGTLTDSEKQAVTLGIGKKEAISYADKIAQQNAPKLKSAASAWDSSATGTHLAVATGINNDPVKVANSVMIVPTGQYQVDPATGRAKRDLTVKQGANNFVLGTPDVASKTYQAFSKDGRLLQSDISEEDKKLYDQVKKLDPLVNGTYKQQQVAKVEAQAKAAQKPPVAQATTGVSPEASTRSQTFNNNSPKVEEFGPYLSTSSTSPAATVEQIDPLQAEIKQTFNLTDTQASTLKTPISFFNAAVRTYADLPAGQNWAGAQLTKNAAIDMLSQTVADSEFVNNEALKLLYTPKKVEEYNKSIDSSLGNMLGITETLKVSDPSSLYYKDRKPALVLQFNQLFDKAVAVARKRANLGQIQPAAQQKTVEFLSNIKAQR